MKTFGNIILYITCCTIIILTCLQSGNDTGYIRGYKDGAINGFNIAMDTVIKISRNQIKSDTTVSKIKISTERDTLVFDLSTKTCLKP